MKTTNILKKIIELQTIQKNDVNFGYVKKEYQEKYNMPANYMTDGVLMIFFDTSYNFEKEFILMPESLAVNKTGFQVLNVIPKYKNSNRLVLKYYKKQTRKKNKPYTELEKDGIKIRIDTRYYNYIQKNFKCDYVLIDKDKPLLLANNGKPIGFLGTV